MGHKETVHGYGGRQCDIDLLTDYESNQWVIVKILLVFSVHDQHTGIEQE